MGEPYTCIFDGININVSKNKLRGERSALRGLLKYWRGQCASLDALAGFWGCLGRFQASPLPLARVLAGPGQIGASLVTQ